MQLAFPRFAALFVSLLVLASLPLWPGEMLPLLDYPNHLARMYLLAHLAEQPGLQQFYEVVWRPLPNLAMDAVVPWLARLVPLALAGKLFVLATFFLIAGGVAVLQRCLFGVWSVWSCLAFLLLYNRLLLWGFLGYLFGAGLALWAFAAWIALNRRGSATRVVLGCLAALLLYFAHLMALGLYGVVVLGFEAGLLLRHRPPLTAALRALAVAGIPFLPPLALMVLGSGAAEGSVLFAQPGRKLDLIFSVFDDYNRPFDVACFLLALGGLGLCFARRWVSLAPAMAAPLVLLGLVYLAMPSQLFTAQGADRRVPLMLFLLLIAGSSWSVPRPRLARSVLAGALLLFLLRLAVVAASWQSSGRIYATLLAGLDAVPPGSRIAVAFPEGAVNVEKTPLAHLAVIAIARRQAFVPTLFAYPTQQPVAIRPDYRHLADRLPPDLLWGAFVTAAAPLDADARAALGEYDYIVFTDRFPFVLAGRSGLAPQFATPRFQLYRVLHQGS